MYSRNKTQYGRSRLRSGYHFRRIGAGDGSRRSQNSLRAGTYKFSSWVASDLSYSQPTSMKSSGSLSKAPPLSIRWLWQHQCDP